VLVWVTSTGCCCCSKKLLLPAITLQTINFYEKDQWLFKNTWNDLTIYKFELNLLIKGKTSHQTPGCSEL
jgi:hypothetical protein